ncbi:MAG: autotransporter-associated beta strand repeat-containing protein [Pirellulales bacterium]
MSVFMPRFFQPMPTLLALFLAGAAAFGADLTWDTLSGDNAVTGGVGNWNNTDLKWTIDGGATNALWDNALNVADTGVFSGTGGLVTLDNAINLQGLRFTGSGYTLTGQSLQLGATQGSIDSSALVGAANTAIINSAFTGTAGLTIAAHGNLSASGGSSTAALTLGGANTGLTGGIAITGGLVAFTNSSAAGSAATTAGSGNALTLTNGGGILLNGSTNLTLGNNIAFGTGGGTIRVFSTPVLTLNGALSGSTQFNKTDSGRLVLANTANGGFTGTANVQAGSLQIGNAPTSGTLTFGGGVNLASGTTLLLSSSSGSTVTVGYSIAGGVTMTGANVSFVQTNNTTQNFAAALAVSGNNTITQSASAFGGHTVNLNGAITGTSGNLTFTTTGGGTARNFTLGSAANNYAGTVTLGTAAVLSTFNLNNTLGVADWAINDADWTVNVSNSTHTIKSLNGSVASKIAAAGANGRLNIGTGDGDSSYGGSLQNLLGITKSGAGTLTLSGVNTYTGSTIVNAGKLLVTGSLANTTTTIQNGGLLGGGGLLAGPTTVQSGGTLSPGVALGIVTFANGLSLESGANLNFELVGDALSVRGTDYDGIDVSGGALTLQDGVLLHLVGGGLDYASTFWEIDRTFKVIDVQVGATFTPGNTFALDTTSAGAFASEGAWSVATDTTGVSLTWTVATTAIPEPGLIGCAGLSVGALALVRLRRRVRASRDET